jgi:hypothetical protein
VECKRDRGDDRSEGGLAVVVIYHVLYMISSTIVRLSYCK